MLGLEHVAEISYAVVCTVRTVQGVAQRRGVFHVRRRADGRADVLLQMDGAPAREWRGTTVAGGMGEAYRAFDHALGDAALAPPVSLDAYRRRRADAG